MYNFDFRQIGKRPPKLPPIPNDYTTIVSIFPRPLKASLVTCEPSFYNVPAGTKERPGILTIGSASWWKGPDLNDYYLEIQVPSTQIASSVVFDNIGAMLGVKLGNQQPGIFFVPGRKTAAEIEKKDIENYNTMQRLWYTELVKMADTDWARHNGNPLVISDIARLAAEELNLKDKAWMGDFRTIEMIDCKACGMPRNPKYPVCPSCHNIVDEKLADSLGIKRAS